MTQRQRPEFEDLYARPQTEADLAVEREVYGANVGVRGYTTLDQADALAERLALRPGTRLLDIGAGRGWPGLYLARQSGCEVVLTDTPAPALLTAAEGARRLRLWERSSFLLASGTRLPFRPRAFDAIVHTDVL